jgi:hypothetical protein
LSEHIKGNIVTPQKLREELIASFDRSLIQTPTWTKLRDLRQREGETSAQYYLRLQTVANRSLQEIPEHVLIGIFIAGLRRKIRIILEEDKFVDLASVRNKAAKVEARLERQLRSEENRNWKKKKRKKNNFNMQTPRKNNERFSERHQHQHQQRYQQHQQQKPQFRNSKPVGSDFRTCFGCGKVGHIQKDCPLGRDAKNRDEGHRNEASKSQEQQKN